MIWTQLLQAEVNSNSQAAPQQGSPFSGVSRTGKKKSQHAAISKQALPRLNYPFLPLHGVNMAFDLLWLTASLADTLTGRGCA